jgi:hypothetical protein
MKAAAIPEEPKKETEEAEKPVTNGQSEGD